MKSKIAIMPVTQQSGYSYKREAAIAYNTHQVSQIINLAWGF